MTQFLLSVYHAGSGPDISADEMKQSFADVDKLNTELMDSGSFVFAGGLLPADTARVARQAGGGDVTVSDGPYVESKEHVGGFWVIEVPGIDDAVNWARGATVACRLPVEVRTFASVPPEVPGK